MPPLEAFDVGAVEPHEYGEATEEDASGGRQKRQKSKKASKKRQYVYDEDLGAVVVQRKRKPGRAGWGEGEY
jgi:hypothetical protein